MRRIAASLFTLAMLTASPAFAVMEDYPSVKLQGLDKSVGRTVTFEAKVGSTIQYGPLYIKIQSCRKAPPIEKPESAAFVQIWEVPPGEEKSQWDFSGWMFASSPALSAMDHPVYDIWVLDCTGREQPNEEAAAAETNEDADQSGLTSTAADPQAETPAAESATELPVDMEAEEPVPTDSEAEPEEAAPAPVPLDPNAAWSPQAYPDAAQPVPAEQQVRPQDPTGGQGATAYDFMDRQGGTNAAPVQQPPQQPYVQPQPGFDPDAPYSPEAYAPGRY